MGVVNFQVVTKNKLLEKDKNQVVKKKHCQSKLGLTLLLKRMQIKLKRKLKLKTAITCISYKLGHHIAYDCHIDKYVGVYIHMFLLFLEDIISQET